MKIRPNSRRKQHKLALQSKKDSLTNIINDVVEKYALKAFDIRSMRKGEKIKVILFDRHIGDTLFYEDLGPHHTEVYLKNHHIAEYIQGEDFGLKGTLIQYKGGGHTITHIGWTWEINLGKWNNNEYWGPVIFSKFVICEDGENFKTHHDIPNETKVGYRGPAILLEDIENMPETFIRYGNFRDDYFMVRNHDLTSFSTINNLTLRTMSIKPAKINY